MVAKINYWSTLIVFTLVVLMQFIYFPKERALGFENGKIWWLYITFSSALILFIANIAVTIYFQGWSKLFDLIKNKQLILILVWLSFIVAFASTVFSPYEYVAIWGTKFRHLGLVSIGMIYFLFLFFTLFTPPRLVKWLVLIYLFAGLIHSFIGIREIFVLPAESLYVGKYVNGNFGQSNFFAAIVLSSIIILFFHLLRIKNIKLKILMVFIQFLLLLVFIATDSRAGLIVGLFLIAFCCFDYFCHKKYKKLKLGFLFFSILLFAVSLIFYTYQNELSRQLYWSDGLKLIQQRPLIGFGADTLLSASSDNGSFNGRIVDRFHNFPMDVVFSFGALYLIIGIIILGYLVKLIINKKFNDEMKIIGLLLLIFLLTGLVHTKSVYGYAEFASFLGIFVSCLAAGRETGSLRYKSR